MDKRLLLLALAVYALVAAALFGPWAGRDREVVAATPSHPPLYQRVPVALEPSRPLCVRPVTLPGGTERVRFGTLDEQPAEIRVVARGDGYEHAAVLTAAGALIDAAIARVPRDVEGEVCFENLGPEPIALLGHADARILSRADPWVDGVREENVDVSVQLLRSRPAGFTSRFGELARHADALGPGFVAPWMIALLAPLVLLGIPGGALAALAVAAKPEDAEQERREEDLHPDDQ